MIQRKAQNGQILRYSIMHNVQIGGNYKNFHHMLVALWGNYKVLGQNIHPCSELSHLLICQISWSLRSLLRFFDLFINQNCFFNHLSQYQFVKAAGFKSIKPLLRSKCFWSMTPQTLEFLRPSKVSWGQKKFEKNWYFQKKTEF